MNIRTTTIQRAIFSLFMNKFTILAITLIIGLTVSSETFDPTQAILRIGINSDRLPLNDKYPNVTADLFIMLRHGDCVRNDLREHVYEEMRTGNETQRYWTDLEAEFCNRNPSICEYEFTSAERWEGPGYIQASTDARWYGFFAETDVRWRKGPYMYPNCSYLEKDMFEYGFVDIPEATTGFHDETVEYYSHGLEKPISEYKPIKDGILVDRLFINAFNCDMNGISMEDYFNVSYGYEGKKSDITITKSPNECIIGPGQLDIPNSKIFYYWYYNTNEEFGTYTWTYTQVANHWNLSDIVPPKKDYVSDQGPVINSPKFVYYHTKTLYPDGYYRITYYLDSECKYTHPEKTTQNKWVPIDDTCKYTHSNTYKHNQMRIQPSDGSSGGTGGRESDDTSSAPTLGSVISFFF